LVQKYGNDYYMKEHSFQLQGNVSRYDLPDDFFKLLGVDLQISAGPDGYVSLRPFTLAERNRYSTANVQTWIGVTNLRYRISANKLWFTPSPQTGQTIRIWYVPRLAELVDTVTLTVNDPVYDDVLSVGPSIFVAGGNFAIGGTNAVTAYNIAEAINNATLSEELTASASGNVITFTQTGENATALSVGNNTTPIAVPGASTRLQKEESDTTTLQFQKAALIKRIEAAAENRDAGSPATIADVQWTNGTWPFGNGFGGGGGIP
jgi:hypothetical protein